MDHLHPDLGLVVDQIEVLRRTRQVLGQGARLLRIEGDEHETAVTVTTVLRQAEVRLPKAWPVPVRDRDPDQVALVGERPVVIRAPERSGLPGRLRADQSPAVSAAVRKHPDHPVGPARHDHRAPADVACHVGARPGHLRFVPDVQPAAIEDPGHLPCGQVVVGVGAAIHPEREALKIIDHDRVAHRPLQFDRHCSLFRCSVSIVLMTSSAVRAAESPHSGCAARSRAR